MNDGTTADVLVPATKLWDGVIVLECSCGTAVDYPGHPDEKQVVECPVCGITYGVAEWRKLYG